MANRITTLFDFKEQGGGLKKIKADMAEVDGSVNKLKTGVKGLWTEFKGNRAAQAAVAGRAIKIGKDAVEAASNLEESINAVNVTYGAQADEIHKLGKVSAESFGLSQRAFNEFAVQFSSFAQQVAKKDGRAVSDVVEEMTGRVADFASVMNLDVAEAARVFQSALAGETEPIKKFGIDMSAAAIEAYALEEGLAASKSEITESIKVTARYGLLMQSTAKTSGDFKNTQDGLANSSRTLKAQYEDLQAVLGQQLLPAVADTTATLVDMASVASDLTNQLQMLGDAVPEEVEQFKDLIGPGFLTDAMIVKPLQGASWAFDKLGLSAEEAGEQVYESTRKAGKSTKDFADDTEESGEKVANAADIIANEIDLARQNIERFGADGVENMGDVEEATEDAKDEVHRFGREWDTLLSKFSDRSAWLDVEDAFDDLQTAWSAAIEAQNEGAENADAMARDAERAMIDLKTKVIDYGAEVNDLPEQVVTNILSLIDQGKLAEAEAALDRLERARTINYIPIVQAPRTPGGFRFSASGTTSSPGGPTVVGERGPELVDMPRGARVRSAVETVTDSRGGGGGDTFITRIDGNVYGVDHLNRILDERDRRMADRLRQGRRG